MLPNLRLHCSSMPNILTFKTPHVRCFLVFGMLKCQIFGIWHTWCKCSSTTLFFKFYWTVRFYSSEYIYIYMCVCVCVCVWLLTFIWEVKSHPIKQVLKAYWNPKLSQYPSPKKLLLENCINLPWCTHHSEVMKNLNFLVWKVAKTLKLFQANLKWSLLRFLFFLYAQK